MQHSLVGGITAHRATIQALHQFDELINARKLPYVVGRDASMVLLVMEGSRRYRRVPPNGTVLPLSCLNLGSASHPEFHGGGLLPATLDKSVQASNSLCSPSLDLGDCEVVTILI